MEPGNPQAPAPVVTQALMNKALLQELEQCHLQQQQTLAMQQEYEKTLLMQHHQHMIGASGHALSAPGPGPSPLAHVGPAKPALPGMEPVSADAAIQSMDNRPRPTLPRQNSFDHGGEGRLSSSQVSPAAKNFRGARPR